MMTDTLYKSFYQFEEGMEEILNLVPDIQDYTGNSVRMEDVIQNLLNMLGEEIASIMTRNSSAEFVLKSNYLKMNTDENLMFGWQVMDNGYKFNIVFIDPPRSKRKYITNLINNGWVGENENNEEVRAPLRRIDKKEPIQEEEETQVSDVQDVQESNEGKRFISAEPLPTFFNEDSEDTDDTDSDNTPVLFDTESVDEEAVVEEQKPQLPLRQPLVNKENKPNRGKLVPGSFKGMPNNKLPSLKEMREEAQAMTPRENVATVQDAEYREINDETIDEIRDARELISAPKQMVLPNGKVTQATQNIIPYSEIDNEPLDPELYNIRRDDPNNPCEVVITYEGEEFPYNVNEPTSGIVRYTASKKLVIEGRIMYDYGSLTVQKLPRNYRPDQAQYIGGTGEMSNRPAVPDESFVPESTIRKNEYLDIESIQEEAMERDNFNLKMGKIPTSKWRASSKLSGINNRSTNIVNTGRAFVMSPPSNNNNINNDDQDNLRGQQSVRIMNDEKPHMRRGGF